MPPMGLRLFLSGILFMALFIWGYFLDALRKSDRKHFCISCNTNAPHQEEYTGTATSGKLFQMKKCRDYLNETTTKYEDEQWTANTTNESLYPQSSQWAVVTTIFKPTKTVLALLRLPGWCTVVVADLKSEAEYTGLAGACLVYLTVEQQRHLPYNILKYLEWNTFARKNIGYLFAMHHGARVIYDTDDDNEIVNSNLLQKWASGSGCSLMLSTDTVVNPYPSYGTFSMWPRGLPLDLIRGLTTPTNDINNNKHNENISHMEGRVGCGIIQSLANVEPDVDAIYRLTPLPYPVNFVERAQVLQVARNSMSPFNAQATLFFEDSFHLMLLPSTVHGRVSDIWRSYFAQHIMASSGSSECRVNFVSPWVSQFRNSHTYMADFDAEIPLYLQASKLVEYLLQPQHETLAELMIDMYEHCIVDIVDVHLSEAWRADLDIIRRIEKKAITTKRFSNLFLAQGRGVTLTDVWIKAMDALPTSWLIYGSFDVVPDCMNHSRITCLYIPATSWTTGRNLLSDAAKQHELNIGMQYTYWTFVDADIKLSCGPGYEHTECMQKYEAFLQSSGSPIVSLFGHMFNNLPISEETKQASMMVQVQAFDACWNSINHDALSIVLPYHADLDSNTWWSSQAIFWYALQCFQPSFGVAPVGIYYSNNEHNPYPQGNRNMESEKAVGLLHLGIMAPELHLPPTEYEAQWITSNVQPIKTTDWRSADLFQKCKMHINY
jgi:STELLO glycosyltransferases